MRLSGTRARAGLVVLTCVCWFAAAVPAGAQTSQMDVSGGYQFAHAQEINFNGWYADMCVPFAKHLSFVGDFSGAYFSESLSAFDFSASVSIKVHTFMGGVRVAKRFQKILVPFGQALAGAAATTGHARISGGDLFTGSPIDGFLPVEPIDASGTAANFAIQLGGGVDVMIHPKVGVRVGASYVRIFSSDTGLNAFRITVGAVMPLGSK